MWAPRNSDGVIYDCTADSTSPCSYQHTFHIVGFDPTRGTEFFKEDVHVLLKLQLERALTSEPNSTVPVDAAFSFKIETIVDVIGCDVECDPTKENYDGHYIMKNESSTKDVQFDENEDFSDYLSMFYFDNLKYSKLRATIRLTDTDHMAASSQAVSGYAEDVMAFNAKVTMINNEPAGTFLRTMEVDEGYDTYLNINASVIKGGKPFCSVDGDWLHCANDASWRTATDDDFGFSVLATFKLPPDLVACACTANPDCVGFSVKNDGTAGTLFELNSEAQAGYFALPAGQPADKTDINATACGDV